MEKTSGISSNNYLDDILLPKGLQSGQLSAGKPPLFSLLIPAFEHPTGVSRILNVIDDFDCRNVECIISDDSSTDAVQQAVFSHRKYQAGHIKYLRNSPKLGATKNWNNLLSMAKGKYISLMHHDECPLIANFFERLEEELRSLQYPDILVLSCLLTTRSGDKIFSHIPQLVSKWLVFLTPYFLLRHNVIGSPSLFVVKKSACVSFDESLRWLVDVDWAVRLIKKSNGNYAFSNNIGIISIFNQETSISEKLKGNLSEIISNEADIIAKKSEKSFIFSLIKPRNILLDIISFSEMKIWQVVFRIFRLISYVRKKPLPEFIR